jgi:K+-transporting ATPase c subunit
LLVLTIIICCGLYPLTVWAIGKAFFPFQADGSLLKGPDGSIVGSKLITQPFTKDEYFQPRPSAASYDASASASSTYAASNYLLRNRVAKWIKDNPSTPQPKASDLTVVFFENFSADYPGMFPSAVTQSGADGKSQTSLQPVKTGSDIQSNFFDMWRQEHADADLQDVPGDLVTASGSGLDPHITLANAEFQLDRVAAKWADDTKHDAGEVRTQIEQILQNNVSAPFDAALIRLFQGLPEIEQIEFQVLKPDGLGAVILTGAVDRERVLASERPFSLRMRLLNLGVTYQMADDHLVLLPATSLVSGPMLHCSPDGRAMVGSVSPPPPQRRPGAM